MTPPMIAPISVGLVGVGVGVGVEVGVEVEVMDGVGLPTSGYPT